MALHILQPGLRPIGQFDLKAGETVTGGEIGGFEADTGTGTTSEDPAAADAKNVGPYSNGDKLMIVLGAPSANDTTVDTDAAQLRFLLDEGTDGYGTLYGSAIGGTAGQGLTWGTSSSGAVVSMGPASNFASGKVTCWHAPGMYAISGTAAANIAAVQVNDNLHADSNGVLDLLTGSGTGDAVALMIGNMFDESLVSTSLAAAGGTATATKHAIYFLGQR